jgi:SAM-dependent methyltransferase
MPGTFYRWFSDRQQELTGFGRARRGRTERKRLGLVMEYAHPPGDMLEIGPGRGSLAMGAVEAGWRYRAMEASTILIEELRRHGLQVIEGWAPPILAPDASCDVVYADQVLEHMSGIDTAREFVAEAQRVLRSGGIFFVVVPDYLTERDFFWDIDYTHNFVTTERRVRQLMYDGGFEIVRVVRSIGAATGFQRGVLAAASFFAHNRALNPVARLVGAEDLLFRIRKNLFETLEFVARKPS